MPFNAVGFDGFANSGEELPFSPVGFDGFAGDNATGVVEISATLAGIEEDDLGTLQATVTTGEVHQDLSFHWYPSADALDTPDVTGLDTRTVNSYAGSTFVFTSNVPGVGNSYYDSNGVLQTLSETVDDNKPRWNHTQTVGYPLGLLTERASVDTAGQNNTPDVSWPWFTAEYGILYADIYFDAADDGLFNPVVFRLSGPIEFLLQVDRVGGTPSYFSGALNTGGQVNRLDQNLVVNAEAGAGRFRFAMGWRDEVNYTDPSGQTSWSDLYCGQWTDAEGTSGADLGAGAGEGVLIGSKTWEHSSRLQVCDVIEVAPTGGSTRFVFVNTGEVRFYRTNLPRAEMDVVLQDLASGRDPPTIPPGVQQYDLLL